MSDVIDLLEYTSKKAKESYSMMGQIAIKTKTLNKDGKVIFRQVIDSLKLFKEKEVIFHTWENLEIACIKLCALITREFPGKNGPLLDEIIESAFDVYRRSSLNKESDIYSMVRFLNVLADASFSIQRTSVYYIAKNGQLVIWPCFSSPIKVWADKNRVDEIYLSPIASSSGETLAGGRILLSSMIMSMNDLGQLAMINTPSPIAPFGNRQYDKQ
jgi:hypothetical protein